MNIPIKINDWCRQKHKNKTLIPVPKINRKIKIIHSYFTRWSIMFKIIDWYRSKPDITRNPYFLPKIINFCIENIKIRKKNRLPANILRRSASEGLKCGILGSFLTWFSPTFFIFKTKTLVPSPTYQNKWLIPTINDNKNTFGPGQPCR